MFYNMDLENFDAIKEQNSVMIYPNGECRE